MAELSVLLRREANCWVIQCLEYDIAAQARTIGEVHYAFERALVGHVVACQENGLQPLECLPPAPQSYWDEYRQGLELCGITPPRFQVPAAVRPVLPTRLLKPRVAATA